jgi:regulator of CtrA degradation
MWARMTMSQAEKRIHRRLIDTLYVDAMVLADEARGYFDDAAKAARDSLDPIARVSFSCESLKVTTRLMHIIAWLLTQRAVDAGEIAPREALDPSRRLGPEPQSDSATLSKLPPEARALVESSEELYRRVARLDFSQAEPAPEPSPARQLLDRLANAF